MVQEIEVIYRPVVAGAVLQTRENLPISAHLREYIAEGAVANPPSSLDDHHAKPEVLPQVVHQALMASDWSAWSQSTLAC